ncbi:MAG TPA: NTPase, partial [bacterium]|nr:NTPase [bacterium]
KNLLLTGRPGVGKTTIVRKVVEQLGPRTCGFFTEEIREESRRTGFKIITTDGREAILAHIHVRSPHRIGRYGVSAEGMRQLAIPTLLLALKNAGAIVIDEIGRMELISPEFEGAVLECLDSPRPVVAVIQMVDLPFLNRIRARPDVEVIEVTLPNRDALPAYVMTRLQELLKARGGPSKAKRPFS